MAPDDRDRNMDKALARHFRSSADALPAAAGSSAPAPSACPDAELLAAYHDGSLSPGELALWKPHVLGCGDCQLILEHLATPLDAPVALDTPVPVVVPAQTAQSSTTFPAIGKTAIPSATAANAAATPSSPAPISSFRSRKTYFRWLVPTGAIAAGLLSWVVIRQSGIPKLGPAEALRDQSAANRPASSTPGLSAPASPVMPERKGISPAPSAGDQQLSAEVDQLKQDLAREKTRQEKDEEGTASGAGAGSAGLSSRVNPGIEKELRQRLQSAPQGASRYDAGAHGPRVTQQQQQAPLNGRLDDANDLAPLDKKKPSAAPVLVEPVTPREEPSFVAPGSLAPPKPTAKVAQSPAPPPPPPPAIPATSGSPASPQPAPPAATKAAPSNEAGGAMAQTVVVESTAPTSMLRTASIAVRGPELFSDPAHKSYWRVGPAGSLGFSSDKGATWTSQPTGVTSDLFTGSAPAAKVCWIVGANGAILRTTDGGKHWLKLHAPAIADILGIHATDAFHATIWLVPDSQSGALVSYKTSDGALTWSLIPND